MSMDGKTVTIKEPYGKVVTGKVVEDNGHSIKVADPRDSKQFYVVSKDKIQNTSFQNGAHRAKQEIANKMKAVGVRAENGKGVIIQIKTADGKEEVLKVPMAEALKYDSETMYAAAQKYVADKHPGAKIKSVGSGTV